MRTTVDGAMLRILVSLSLMAACGEPGGELAPAAAPERTALERLEAAVTAAPDDREAWSALARARLDEERYSDAATAAERALELSGEGARADDADTLARARLGEERWEAARAAFTRVLELDEDPRVEAISAYEEDIDALDRADLERARAEFEALLRGALPGNAAFDDVLSSSTTSGLEDVAGVGVASAGGGGFGGFRRRGAAASVALGASASVALGGTAGAAFAPVPPRLA